MTVINLGLHGGRIGGIFITGIFGNFYTKRGEFLTFKTGIPGGLGHQPSQPSRSAFMMSCLWIHYTLQHAHFDTFKLYTIFAVTNLH